MAIAWFVFAIIVLFKKPKNWEVFFAMCIICSTIWAVN